jgi:hypothetical protein
VSLRIPNGGFSQSLISSFRISHFTTMLRNYLRSPFALPFEYSFLADDLAAQYEAEARMAKVFPAGALMALLAVLVACLGHFGLAAFTAERPARLPRRRGACARYRASDG